MAFVIHALPADALDRARAGDTGAAVVRLVATGGEALRCCLADAERDTELILFNYAPPLPGSPYQETGAVYAHARPCAGPAAIGAYPSGWYGRTQVLRAYDDRGWIHPSTRVHDGSDPEASIAEMLHDPAVAQIHSRNVAYGCYMFAVTRA
jgi:hypothetical protein